MPCLSRNIRVTECDFKLIFERRDLEPRQVSCFAQGHKARVWQTDTEPDPMCVSSHIDQNSLVAPWKHYNQGKVYNLTCAHCCITNSAWNLAREESQQISNWMKVQIGIAFKISMMLPKCTEKKTTFHMPLISQPGRAICGCFSHMALLRRQGSPF